MQLKRRRAHPGSILIDTALALPGLALTTQLLARRLGLGTAARDLADDLMPLLLRGTVASQILLTLRRAWPGMLVAVPATLYAAQQLGLRRGSNAPSSQNPPADTTLRVLSFNMAHWHGQLTPLLDLFHRHEADVVVIQELRHDCVAALRETLGQRYPYQALNPLETPYGGQGMLSRYPLHEVSFFTLNADAFNHQRAVVEWPQRRFVLYSAHPPSHAWQPFDPTRRRRELEQLLARTQAEQLPLIMAGDFNMTEYTRDYALVRRSFQDAFASVGQGLGATWPDLSPWELPGLPFFRIDYVFHSADFSAVRAEVLPSAHSDHRPLLATLAMQ